MTPWEVVAGAENEPGLPAPLPLEGDEGLGCLSLPVGVAVGIAVVTGEQVAAHRATTADGVLRR